MITFGRRLKELREKKEMSQEELGRRFNLSQSTIAYYEMDKKQPSQNTLHKMADYFEVTTDYLLGRDLKIEDKLIDPTEQVIREIAAEYNIDLTDPEQQQTVRDAFRLIFGRIRPK